MLIAQPRRSGARSGRLTAALLAAAIAGCAAATTAHADPGTAERDVIGYSVKGRPIEAIRTQGPGEATNSLVVIGLIHGNERAGLKVVAALSELELPAGLELTIVPSMNPDGQTRGTRTNAHGVDLNRNFPRDWVRTSTSGASPVSEPETQAIVNLLSSQRPDAVLILHQALYGVDTSIPRTKQFGRLLATNMGLPRKPFRCSGVCHGTLTGWFDAAQAGVAVTIELNSHPSTSLIERVASGAIAATVELAAQK